MDKSNEYIRFDWAIKHLLREKSNFEILEGLISVLLGQDVKIEEILENESDSINETCTFTSFYLQVKIGADQYALFRIQVIRQLFFLKRLTERTCTIVQDVPSVYQLDNITTHQKVYSISILYCEFGEGDDYVYRGTTEFKGIHTGTDLVVRTKEDGVIVSHFPSQVFPEYFLVRVNAYDKIPETPLEEWMDYLKTGMVKEDTTTPGLQRVKEKLKVLSMSKEERQAYDRHIDNIMVQNDVLDTAREEGRDEGFAEGRTEGLAEGRAEGRAEERLEIAKKLLALGLPEEAILQSTGLSSEQLHSL